MGENTDKRNLDITLYPKQYKVLETEATEILYGGSLFSGKGTSLDTPLLTTDGWKTMGTVDVGDCVFGQDGLPTKVIAKSEVYFERTFETRFDNFDTPIVVGENHEWLTLTENEFRKNNKNTPVKRKTLEIYETQKTRDNKPNHRIRVTSPLERIEQDLEMPPYFLGARLAIIEIESCENKHIPEKYIPEAYKKGSYTQRLELIKGIMDTAGSVTESGSCELSLAGHALVNDVLDVLRSLGIKVNATKAQDVRKKDSYIMSFYTQQPVFTFHHSLERLRAANISKLTDDIENWIISSVKEIDQVPLQCIQVDNQDNMYLVGEYLIPTHNSFVLRYASILYCSYIPGIQVYLFRRNFEDLKKNHMYGHHGFINVLDPFIKAGKCNINYSSMRIDFFHDNGKTAQVHLCHLNNVSTDLPKYQGSEMHVILIDESASFPEEAYVGLRNRLRLGTFKIDYDEVRKHLPFIKDDTFPRIICASNPVGVGMEFFKKRFIDPAPPNEVFVDPREPITKKLFIPAYMWDNVKGMEDDPGYMQRVASSGSAAQQALIYGQWDVNESAVLGDLWDKEVHVIPPIKVPKNAFILRSMDWGTFHPSVILYFLVANGEIYEGIDGYTFQPKPGSLIVINEIYNCSDEKDNEGNRKSAVEVGRQIAEFEASVPWIDDIRVGVADNQIFRKGAISETIADLIVMGYNQFMNQKAANDPNFRWAFDVMYLFDKADQSAGSRVSGLNLVRNYLKSALDGDDRGLYLVNHCRKTITELPIIPRSETNPEDAEQSQSVRDHGFDVIKMTLLSRQQEFQSLDVIGI